MSAPIAVRVATPGDAALLARRLHDFNTEYGEETPGVTFLTRRLAELLARTDVVALCAGPEDGGVALLRLYPNLWDGALVAYLEELYVVPDRRRRGIGLALMEGVLAEARVRGASWIHVGTEEDDTGARALYERLGFENGDAARGGAASLYYERKLT